MENDPKFDIEIPCYFLCPISMQLMKDPVTISTGITYDRENIEKWLFSFNNTTCPATKQQLSGKDLTPNHTLRRLIQSWCTLNAYERFPTPKPPIDKSQILKLINQAKNSPNSQITCLHRLNSIAQRNESSKMNLQIAGAVEFLASIVRKNEDPISRDEALNILQQIDLSDSDLKKLITGNNGGFSDSLTHVLKTGDSKSRSHAIMLLKSTFSVADPEDLIGSKSELFNQIINILIDKISPIATKSALRLLIELCPWGRNRIKAVENGAVPALIETLLETSDRRISELVLTALDQLCGCGCADGRAELLRHGAGLAVVSKKILRISIAASERGVRILSSISKYSASDRVLVEMAQVGVVAKLCLVMQVESVSHKKIKERAMEILRMNSRVWKECSCVPSHLISSYPS